MDRYRYGHTLSARVPLGRENIYTSIRRVAGPPDDNWNAGSRERWIKRLRAPPMKSRLMSHERWDQVLRSAGAAQVLRSAGAAHEVRLMTVACS